MSVTGDLRAMLDERDVKYMVDDYSDYEVTEWNGPYNLWWRFTYNPYDDVPYGEVQLLDTGGATHLTPEQAIAATLGAGTCHMERDFRRWDDDLGWLTSYTCSVCGESVILMSDRKPSCCPNCGCKAVDE